MKWPDGEVPATGDSIAVDGACLTVIDPTRHVFCSRALVGDPSPNPLPRRPSRDSPSISSAPSASAIASAAISSRDTSTGSCASSRIRPEGGFQTWRLSLPTENAKEVAAKGSVALNGVSLTVADLGRDWFEVALIPTTLEATSLGGLRTGAELHLETDVLAKYVARRIGGSSPSALDEMFGGGGGA